MKYVGRHLLSQITLFIYLWTFLAKVCQSTGLKFQNMHSWCLQFRRSLSLCTYIFVLPCTPSLPNPLRYQPYFPSPSSLSFLLYILFRLLSSVSIHSSITTLYCLIFSRTSINIYMFFSLFVLTQSPPNLLRIYLHLTVPLHNTPKRRTSLTQCVKGLYSRRRSSTPCS